MKLRTFLIEITKISLLPSEAICPNSEGIVDHHRQQSEVEPLKAVFDGRRYWLFDGYHRMQALSELGRNAVRVTVYRGDQRDALRRYIRDKLSAREHSHRIPVFRHCLEQIRADSEWSKMDPKELSRMFGRKPQFFENVRLLDPSGRTVLFSRTRQGRSTLFRVRS